MDGAFTIIYSKQGFMQLPKHWFPIPVTLTMPENLMTLQSKLPHRDDELSSTYLLTNGGCGKIQLMNVNDREHCVQTVINYYCVDAVLIKNFMIIYLFV